MQPLKHTHISIYQAFGHSLFITNTAAILIQQSVAMILHAHVCYVLADFWSWNMCSFVSTSTHFTVISITLGDDSIYVWPSADLYEGTDQGGKMRESFFSCCITSLVCTGQVFMSALRLEVEQGASRRRPDIWNVQAQQKYIQVPHSQTRNFLRTKNFVVFADQSRTSKILSSKILPIHSAWCYLSAPVVLSILYFA